MNPPQIKQKIAELQEQLKQMELKEKEKDFQKVIYNKKEFRIYKWDKPIKDFPMPEGFSMSEHSEFVELYDEGKIELEQYPVEYFVKHYSKIQQKKEWCVSRLYLNGDLGLYSRYEDLAGSDDYGRVVVVRSIK